jgi:tetratricopeptide (TPR) repeat protein
MDKVRTRIVVLLCAGLIALTPSCSFIQRVTAPAGHDKKLVDDTSRQAQGYLALGEYKKALALYAAAYDKYHYPGMRVSYIRTGEQIKNTADATNQRKEFFEAGGIYRLLFESGITTRDFAGSLSFDDDVLSSQIKSCAKGLMEIGLMKYREEKLDEAISIWEKVLVFDPDNKEVIKAIDTATRQRENLKNLK